MDYSILLDYALCMAFGVFFATCRTLANNLDQDDKGRLKGWALFSLMAINGLFGVACGSLIVPLIHILHGFVPQIEIDRSWYLISSSYAGWVGLPKIIKMIEKEAKAKLKGGRNDAHDSEGPGGSTAGRNRIGDSVPVQEDSGPQN